MQSLEAPLNSRCRWNSFDWIFKFAVCLRRDEDHNMRKIVHTEKENDQTRSVQTNHHLNFLLYNTHTVCPVNAATLATGFYPGSSCTAFASKLIYSIDIIVYVSSSSLEPITCHNSHTNAHHRRTPARIVMRSCPPQSGCSNWVSAAVCLCKMLANRR